MRRRYEKDGSSNRRSSNESHAVVCSQRLTPTAPSLVVSSPQRQQFLADRLQQKAQLQAAIANARAKQADDPKWAKKAAVLSAKLKDWVDELSDVEIEKILHAKKRQPDL